MEQSGFQIGAYSVLSRLGVGGMGEVWLATKGGQKCVVKTLLPHLADDERVREMFLKEGRVAAMISDPGVVQIYELGLSGGQYFMALEYVDGVSLDRLFTARRKLSPLIAAYLASRALGGLQAIHEQAGPGSREALKIVHRDISPSNLLLSIAGDVKVADFGIAKTFTTDPGGATTHGTAKGKVAYMSPEQARGQAVDQRTDLFALGIVMYEALAGDIPYARSRNDLEMLSQVVYGRKKPLETLAPGVPPELAEVISHALKLDPDERWPSARAMKAPLDAWLEHEHGIERARGELAELVKGLRETPSSTGHSETREVGHVGVALQKLASPIHETVFSRPAAPMTAEPVTAAPAAPPARRRRSPVGFVVGGACAALGLVAIGWAALYTPEPEEPAPADVAPVVVEREPVMPAPLGAVGEDEGRPAATPSNRSRVRPVKRSVPPPVKPVAPPEKLLAFETQPPVDVYAGDKKLGRTPLEVSMPGASAQLRLVSAADGIDFDYELKGEQPQRFAVPRATLHVRVDPWAEVTLDGRPLGMTPMAPITVFAGRHVIVLVNAEKKARRQVDVKLEANEMKVVREKL
ncbi:MAG: serine/threonine protein kinase [Archangiaceae bacterium]|nr:serine/threonine protein kinase [Archangiaceae bacterium]